jgi:hypothetical protein
MSGIEAAGFILAVIPLIISAAEHYNDGLNPIKRVFRTPLEIRKFYLALNDQKTYLRLSLIALFGKLPSLSQSQKQALTDRDGDLSSLLEDEDLQEELQDALGQAYESYMANLDAIVSALEKLVVRDKSLKLNPTVSSQYTISMNSTDLSFPVAIGSLDFTCCLDVFQSTVGLVSVINSLPCYHMLSAIIALPYFIACAMPFVSPLPSLPFGALTAMLHLVRGLQVPDA